MKNRTRLSLLLAPVLLAALAPDPASAPRVIVKTDRVVFLGGGLTDEELLVFTTTIAASGHPGLVLLDSPSERPYLGAFLEAFRPEQVVPVGSFPDGLPGLERRLGKK